jgi:hypothetical protein
VSRSAVQLRNAGPWRADFGPEWSRLPIARLRYTKASRTWTLYWRDRNLRFHRYDRIEPSVNLSDLIRELDRDPTNISGVDSDDSG